jgi:hypothetical protein
MDFGVRELEDQTYAIEIYGSGNRESIYIFIAYIISWFVSQSIILLISTSVPRKPIKPIVVILDGSSALSSGKLQRHHGTGSCTYKIFMTSEAFFISN